MYAYIGRTKRLFVVVCILACLCLSLFGCEDGSIVEYQLTLISPPSKTEYCLGEKTFDVSGMVVKIKDSLTGDEETISHFAGDNRFGVSGFDNTKVGEQTVTLTFTVGDFSTNVTFVVEVLDIWLDSAKSTLSLDGDMLEDAYEVANTQYAGGVSATDDVESRIYLSLGSSKTDISVTPSTYVPNTTERTLYRKYFELGVENAVTYSPITYQNANISIAWVTLMTESLPIKINAYDTIYTYTYPYTATLSGTVEEGKCYFDVPLDVKYCYVIDGSIVSVESIYTTTAPTTRQYVALDGGVIQDGNVTIVVPGYAKLNVTI